MKNFRFHSSCIVRIPALPFMILLENSDNKETAFQQIINDAYFKSALYLSSRELYLEFYKALELGDRTSENFKKLRLSVKKYLNRMASRSTPFGLNGGCFVCPILPGASKIVINPASHHIQYVQFDYNIYEQIFEQIKDRFRKQLSYVPNSTIYKKLNRIRYFEFENQQYLKKYSLSSVQNNTYLNKILTYCAGGKNYQDIVHLLCQEGFDDHTSSQFVNALINDQLLRSEIEMTVIGSEYIDHIKQSEWAASYGHEYLGAVEKILPKYIHEPANIIESESKLIDLGITQNLKDLFQTDLYIDAVSKQICREDIQIISTQIASLWKLSYKADNNYLDDFVKKFEDKYGELEVPLLTALDPELGIGYKSDVDTSPLVQNLPGPKTTPPTEGVWTDLLKYKFDKLLQAYERQVDEIEIDDVELELFGNNKNIQIPDSFYVMGKLIYHHEDVNKKRKFSFDLINFSGPSAANLIARFAMGNQEIHDLAREIVKEEESFHPEYIYAEASHLPNIRYGNVIKRPSLRSYEIVIDSGSQRPKVCQIFLRDILASVRNGRILLRSKKLGKYLIPRLTNAHNFGYGTMSAYTFLGDLQYQDSHLGFSWNWGVLESYKKLPRVRYKNIILSKLKWNLTKGDFNLNKIDMNSAGLAHINKIMDELGIPKLISVSEGDRALTLDRYDTVLGMELIKHINKEGRLTISEFFQDDGNPLVRDTAGKWYANELIIPFSKEHDQASTIQGHQVKDSINDLCRNFPIGSDWMYFKIYANPKLLETLLVTQLYTFITQLNKQQLVDKWFFIRYQDPQTHIRLRLHKKNIRHADIVAIVNKVLGTLVNDKLIKLVMDTYERELERYSQQHMEIAETIFFEDSLFTMKLLKLLKKDAVSQNRWQIAIYILHAYLDACQIDLAEREELLMQLFEFYAKQFKGIRLSKQLDNDYRAVQTIIRDIVESASYMETTFSPEINTLLVRRTKSIHASLCRIDSQWQKKLVPSFIHMFMNRIFDTRSNDNEMVTYYFLSKFYKSKQAREKTAVPN